MASYPPPIPLNQGLFNPASFTDPNEGGGLTIAQANSLFLRYPTAQGDETLSDAIIAGKLSTTNTDDKSLVYGYQTTETAGASSAEHNTAFGYQAGKGYSTLTTSTGGNSAFGALTMPSITTSASNNTAVGHNSLSSLTSGSRNTAVGTAIATSTITTGTDNTCIGYNAKTLGNQSNTVVIGASAKGGSDGDVIIGSTAGKNLSGALRNIAIGSEAMGVSAVSKTLTAGSDDNVCIGLQSGYVMSGANTKYNIGIGNYSLGGGLATSENTTGQQNVCIGVQVGKNITSGTENVGIGYQTLGGVQNNPLTGSNNMALGKGALANINGNGNNNTCMGWNSGFTISTSNSNTCVGYEAGYTIGANSNNTFIGNQAGRTVAVADTTCIGSQSGRNITTALRNIAIGNQAIGVSSATKTLSAGGDDNLCIGLQSGYLLSGASASKNIAIGNYAFGGSVATTNTNTGNNNIMIGVEAGKSMTSGNQNIGIGFQTNGGYQATLFTNSNNTFLGHMSGCSNAGGGNTGIGHQSMYGSSPISGINNTCLGRSSGNNITTGNTNVCVGYLADVSAGARTNTVVIGANAKVGGDGNVSIGSSAGINGGSDNVVIGENANGYSATARTGGNNNVCIGKYSGRNLNGGSASGSVGVGSLTIGGFDATTSTTGVQNTAVGYGALQKVSSGANNVGLGYQALGNTTTGGDNIAIGVNAGAGQITGGNNTYVGRGADGTDGLSYSTAIGAEATATVSNSITLGRVNTDAVRLNTITPMYSSLPSALQQTTNLTTSPTVIGGKYYVPYTSMTIASGVASTLFTLTNVGIGVWLFVGFFHFSAPGTSNNSFVQLAGGGVSYGESFPNTAGLGGGGIASPITAIITRTTAGGTYTLGMSTVNHTFTGIESKSYGSLTRIA